MMQSTVCLQHLKCDNAVICECCCYTKICTMPNFFLKLCNSLLCFIIVIKINEFHLPYHKSHQVGFVYVGDGDLHEPPYEQ